MAKDTAIRIAERNEAAQKTLQAQDGSRHIKGRMGLWAANTYDRLTGWIHDDRRIFAGAITDGLLRALVYGTIATVLTLVTFTGLGIAPNLLWCAIVGGSAAVFGAYEGQKALEKNLYSNPRHFSDWIAEKSGAVPEKGKRTPAPERTAQEINSGQPVMGVAERAAAGENKSVGAGFAAREEARRARAMATSLQP